MTGGKNLPPAKERELPAEAIILQSKLSILEGQVSIEFIERQEATAISRNVWEATD